MLFMHLNVSQIPLVNLLKGFHLLSSEILIMSLFLVDNSSVKEFLQMRIIYFYQIENLPYILINR
jgi:hypothetical protein